jgi:carbon monoxide dehydrogenase subunit G
MQEGASEADGAEWKGFAAPSKRVAAVQKGAQTKLITVAELKQVQAIAMMSPLRQLDSILLSMAGLSFLMSRSNRSEIKSDFCLT